MVSHSSGSTSSRRPGEPARRTPAAGDAAAAELLAAELAAMEAIEEMEGEAEGAWELTVPGELMVPGDAAGLGEPLGGATEVADTGLDAARPTSSGGGSAQQVSAATGAGVDAARPTNSAAGSDSGSGSGSHSGSGSGPDTAPPAESPLEAAAEPLVEVIEAAEAAAVRPNRRAQAARLAFLALTLAAGAYAVAKQWGRVREGFEDLGPLPLIIALLPALASVSAMMLAWRGLLGSLGSPLRLRPAARIFFTSQLGKYLPGSVWPVVAQMQLGRAYRIPRARSAAAAALAMLVSLVTALVLAAATLSVAGGARSAGYWWAFAAVPVLLAGLHPRVANPALKTIFRVTRRPAIEPLTGETIRKTAGRSLVGWLLAGAHIWVLAVALGAAPWRTLLLGIGGYAFAWSVGFLIVFAPAGAGVREIILVAALQPVLDPGKATVVALASRLVTIVADLVAAAVTAREGGAPRGDEADSEAVELSAD